jgi:hypothetical protein
MAMSRTCPTRFQPGIEALEDRQLLSATPTAIATVLTHGTENYTNMVTNAYRQYLGRLPDSAELTAWVSAMQHGLSDEQLEADFVSSPEYIQTKAEPAVLLTGGPDGGRYGSWLQDVYHDMLGRSASAAEVSSWASALAHGMSREAVAHDIATSAECETTRIVNDYQKYLGRTPGANEATAWLSAFQHGLANEDVVAGFVGSGEYYSRTGGSGNSARWLTRAYQDILGRTPSDAECLAWVGTVPAGSNVSIPFPGVATDAEPVKATWLGEVEVNLRQEAPQSGYIASQQEWAKLWKAFRGTETLPEIDFTKDLILVAVNKDPNHISIIPSLDANGELHVTYVSTLIGFVNPRTCSYELAVISREGIKTINGQPLPNN